MEIHPVAVLIARVTYLLALGTGRLTGDRGPLTVPVYLGDSLLWNTKPFLADREVLIEAPADEAEVAGGAGGPVLAFPFTVTRDPGLFDQVIEQMLSLSARGSEADELRAWLERNGVTDLDDLSTIAGTYLALRKLVAADRNHIWGYVARNLSRPIWLSTDEQRADVVIGNPPWLSYRFMAADFQARFREQSQERGIWAGGRLATHQDLSALFFVRSIEFYLKPGGQIAFVMPLAALTRQQFAGFRTGVFQSEHEAKMSSRKRPPPQVTATFGQAWALDERVQPLFPVPSSVVFAIGNTATGSPIPSRVRAYAGELPRRDASPDEAKAALTIEEVEIVALDSSLEGPPYRDQFRQGATVVPQLVWMVQRVTGGKLGGNPATPLVESRRHRGEKPPWRDLPSLRGQVESAFLRPLLLGSSLAPYRLLAPIEAVIPWGEDGQLSAASAGAAGYPRLSQWLGEAETAWDRYGKKKMKLADRLDYHRALATQMGGEPLRVVYAASGTLPAAAVVRDPTLIAEHKLYWIAVETEEEARYLAAILNSEAARALVAHLQSRGQWGARDFDKVMLSLRIPTFDPGNALHAKLAAAAARAETVAAAVDLEGLRFQAARGRIREALAADGVAGEVDDLVRELVGALALPEIPGEPDGLLIADDEDELNAPDDEEAEEAGQS